MLSSWAGRKEVRSNSRWGKGSEEHGTMPLKGAPMGSLWGRRTTHTLYESTERKYPKWANPERERKNMAYWLPGRVTAPWVMLRN